MNFNKTNRPESIVCEQQAKFVQERITNVESTFANLCSAFSLFSRKAARLRDANDEIAKIFMSYAETELINKSLKCGLSEVAKSLHMLGDFRDLEVQRLEKKVVDVFSQYEGICHRAKNDLKMVLNARDKELNHQRQLDRLVERNPHNRQQISKVEAELTKAKNEVSRNQKVLEEQVDLFEKNKLKDVKLVIKDFIKIEMALHAKAIELYTRAYNDMDEVDVEQDLEELKSALANEHARLDTVKRTSFRSASLQSIANLFSTPQKLQRKGSTGIPIASSTDELRATPANPDQNPDSRIISLRDDSEDDDLPSPFAASSLRR